MHVHGAAMLRLQVHDTPSLVGLDSYIDIDVVIHDVHASWEPETTRNTSVKDSGTRASRWI